MARSKRRASRASPEGGGKTDESDRAARLDSVLESLEADLRQILERLLQCLEELGHLSDLDDGGVKVLLQMEIRSPYVCTVSVSSKSLLDRLSPREKEVLRLLRKGCSTKEIAAKLGIKPRTVETHIRRVSDKLNVHSRVLLAQHARLLG
jgi:DNA-binding CsgD family transcriptional regulator